MTTPNPFELAGSFVSENLMGSVVIAAVFIIAVLVILILAARISFKVGLVIIFPALLAIMGIGISEGLLGTNYRWIAVLIVIGLALGGLGFTYFKFGE